jgi:hypothetical protein
MFLLGVIYMSLSWLKSKSALSGNGVANDKCIRTALDWHCAASEAGDRDGEHSVYSDGAILEYPQSGERICGRRNIQVARSQRSIEGKVNVRRVLGRGDVWIKEYVVLDGERPLYTVSIMEFRGRKVVRETQYFAESSVPRVGGDNQATGMERLDPAERFE